jgi:hypothetical protein
MAYESFKKRPLVLAHFVPECLRVDLFSQGNFDPFVLIPEPSLVFLVGQPFKDQGNDRFPITSNRVHQPPVFMKIEFPEIIDPVPGDICFGDQALWDLYPTECIESERIECFV